MSRSNDGQPTEDAWVYGLVLAALLGGMLWVLWSLWHPQITYWSAWFYWWAWAPLDWRQGPTWPRAMRGELTALAQNAPWASFESYWLTISKASYLFLPFVLGIAWRAWRTMATRPWVLARRVVNLKTLPWILAKEAPAGIPALYMPDLLLEDPPEWRSAQSPDEWAIARQVVVGGRVDRQKTLAALASDLGRRVTTPDDLLPHERAMLAVLAPRIVRRPDDYGLTPAMLDSLNRSCHTGVFNGKRGFPDLSIAADQFEKFRHEPKVLRYFEVHGYASTVLYAMHSDAIQDGRIPTSNFLWLKPMDRGLFYALETTGRKVPFVESLAVFTQARWEEYIFNLGARLNEPHLEDAMKAIEAYLGKFGFINLPKKKKIIETS